MTAAVPLIHAFTVAMVTGIMVEQTGELEGRRGGGGGRGGGESWAGDVGERRGNGEEKAKDALKVYAGERAFEK